MNVGRASVGTELQLGVGIDVVHEYRREVLEQLAIHGIVPKPSTSPELLREYLSDLYRYEIRRLKARLLRGEFPKAEYLSRVVDLRLRYPLLSIPVHLWMR